jgi:Zn-dependent protease
VIPAVPLDGERALHAVLWGRWDDFAGATRVDAAIGRGFGVLLIAGGLGDADPRRRVQRRLARTA